jgi:hypothetical protein
MEYRRVKHGSQDAMTAEKTGKTREKEGRNVRLDVNMDKLG